MYTKASNKASQKYNAKAYDRLAVRVYKGQAEQITAYAAKKGMSLNAYINSLIAADMGERLTKPTKEQEQGD